MRDVKAFYNEYMILMWGNLNYILLLLILIALYRMEMRLARVSFVKLLVLFIVCAIRRTGQSGFPSSGFPTHRLINDTNTACKTHYVPLCTTHLSAFCGHEMNNTRIDINIIFPFIRVILLLA